MLANRSTISPPHAATSTITRFQLPPSGFLIFRRDTEDAHARACLPALASTHHVPRVGAAAVFGPQQRQQQQ